MIDFDGACEDYDARPSDSEAADKFRRLGFDQLAESCKAEAQRQAEAGKNAAWKASAICATAARLVGGDRERTHGDKLSNFTNIARMWNAILAAKYAAGGDLLDAHDVANMMEAMKIARRYTGTVNRDDYVDGAGYAGVAGEVVQRSSTCSM